jgi:hypothetical protein
MELMCDQVSSSINEECKEKPQHAKPRFFSTFERNVHQSGSHRSASCICVVSRPTFDFNRGCDHADFTLSDYDMHELEGLFE